MEQGMVIYVYGLKSYHSNVMTCLKHHPLILALRAYG